MPPPAEPKPPKEPPPLRMGDRSDQVRQHKAKIEEKHQAEAKIRTRIYQDILALLDIAERLTLDLSSQEDRFGIEWNGLARQIHAQYNADLLKNIPGFQAMAMSKEGAHGLPKGLYRNLLDFAEECAGFLKCARSANDGAVLDPRPPKSPAPESGETHFRQACERFKKACVEMRQQICIFENERAPGEESFFG